jgi:hypothetical protein
MKYTVDQLYIKIVQHLQAFLKIFSRMLSAALSAVRDITLKSTCVVGGVKESRSWRTVFTTLDPEPTYCTVQYA